MTTQTETEKPQTTATNETQDSVDVKTPEFQSFVDVAGNSPKQNLNQFADIKITVSAELGRASLPIERLLSLGNGSVIELDREIDMPIELVAQGIPLACGEVVVVNDCFAIRITSVYPRNRKGETLSIEK
jgi:flagellar motor switch protein FliN/FliY